MNTRPIFALAGNLSNSFRELTTSREVLYNFVSQDFKIKYKRTFFGYLWSLLNPILQLVIQAAVFSHVIRLPVRDYTLYLFSGLIPWTFFSAGVATAGLSYLEYEQFMKKVYLPKLIFPVSKICLRLIDFLMALVALMLIMVAFGFRFHLPILILPLAILNFSLFTLGVGTLFAVMTVYFRDMQYLVGVFLQLAYFATPIMYPVSLLPQKLQTILSWNPIYLELRVFQDIISAGIFPSAETWAVAGIVSIFTLGTSLILLTSLEQDMMFRL